MNDPQCEGKSQLQSPLIFRPQSDLQNYVTNAFQSAGFISDRDRAFHINSETFFMLS